MKEYKVGDKVWCDGEVKTIARVDVRFKLNRECEYYFQLDDDLLNFYTEEDIELYEEKPFVCATCAIDNIVKKSKTLSEWHKELELITLIDKVKEWSIERNIDKANPKEQTLKLLEEIGELASALLKSNNDLIIDSLGDILVVLVILHQQLGLTMEQTLSYAYNEIKDRKGKTIGGVFVKDSDL